MIEKIIMNTLSSGTGIPAYMEVPEEATSRFFVIERTGGGQRGSEMRAAIFAVQSYGESLLEAAELNEQALTIMAELPYTEDTVATCELNSSYNFTNTLTRRYRYQAVFDLVYFI